ncbi:nucleotidyltransferase domain-containing protein [Desulfobotulus sp.]|uniref:nucleotidyltransferase family protein n=1 Tax=Desulfobotulus sp. TaxID=1940337 RepID=UPI002A361DD7|nr:nucleotidyltransferase domain-containing protein [Desulfobotulus sp.]MDY0163533.1 nucleotidyltransferase domain-containing protein [Desulfobotulus sp.]
MREKSMEGDRAFGLPDGVLAKIIEAVFACEGVRELLLFGSRAKDNFRTGSDIDLALVGEGLTLKELNRIRVRLDDLCLPYTIDLVDYGNIEALRVKAHIDGKGIVLASRKEKNDSLLPEPPLLSSYIRRPQ